MTKALLKMASIQIDSNHGAPVGFPFCFFCPLYIDNIREFDEILDWCRSRHGEDGPDEDWYERYGAIFFRREDDAMEFKIRWG
jgi:hypothetical protein